MRIKSPYMPKIGDHVSASRKIELATPPKIIVGPVTEVSENTCRIITNAGDKEIEGNFLLNYSDWKFQFLF